MPAIEANNSPARCDELPTPVEAKVSSSGFCFAYATRSATQLRNISRAAAQISVAQSVVSRHLGALEAQLGCRLFERTGRGVVPTPAADQLAPPLQAAIAQMQRATQQAVDLGNQPSGVVRVGLVPVVVRTLVGPLQVRVSRELPPTLAQGRRDAAGHIRVGLAADQQGAGAARGAVHAGAARSAAA